MADILPFAAWHYNTPDRVNPADVLTEPYDKITPAMQAAYYDRSPYNLIQIELGRDEPGDGPQRNKYTRAAEHFNLWRKQRILVQHPQPAFCLYEQRFEWPAGQWHSRRALIARVRLSPFTEGNILPHEQTLSKPKQDRLNLLRATQAYFGQIFLLYDGKKANWQTPDVAAATRPILEFRDENAIQHRLVAVSDESTVRTVQEAFENVPLYIADGHHRYETALTYRDECRAQVGRVETRELASDFVMAALVDRHDTGLIILPTHRVIKNISNFDAGKFRERLLETFQMEQHPDLKFLLEHLARVTFGTHSFGMFLPPNHFWLLRLRPNEDLSGKFVNHPPLWGNIDTAILQMTILEPLLGIDEKRVREESNVEYHREASVAELRITQSEGQVAFFLNPTPVEQVIAIANARSRMPQKSTDFYPKFPSGLTIYDVSEK